MSKYEIAVYNEEVRKLVREGKRHRRLRDDWADVHYIEIEADNEASARTKASTRYPSEQGYVIDYVGHAG